MLTPGMRFLIGRAIMGLMVMSVALFHGETYAFDGADAVQFGWSAEGVAVRVDDQPVNTVLEVISAATGIPILLDPLTTARLNGLYRRRTLEELLLDLSPGMVIQYRHDERLNTHVIDRVYSSSMVDAEVKQSQLRSLVINREQLEEGIVPPINRPVRYSGIGAAVRLRPDSSGIFIQPLSPASPAARAGLRLGDIVIAVDGRPVQSFTNIVDVTNAIRGPENTEVVLSVRLPDGTVQDRNVTREVFTYKPE